MNIRLAQPQDQEAIRQIIHAARLNPIGLDWQHFVVAEEKNEVIGVGQVKLHKDGSRELASIAVIPAWQKRGVGSALIRKLLERETGTLYLMCRGELESYYARFGFRPIGVDEMTPYFRRISRVANVMMPLVGRLHRPLIMKREQITNGVGEQHGK